MSSGIRLTSAALLAVLAGTITLRGQITTEDAEKIQRALPASSTVRPQRPRLLLIFTRAEGYRHASIPYCAAALTMLGKQTGAFETVQSDDYSVFLPDNLKRFDGVCFDNTTQLAFEDPVIRKSLLDFVAGGKGIVGIHAATDNFPTWPDGQALMGGVFDGHPWTADGTWAVANVDPSHPLTAAFGGKGFRIRDEIYRVRQIDLRKNGRVLLALDMHDRVNREAGGVRSTDRDIPVSWVKTVGKGRLFYCSLGHNNEVFWNPAVLRHYLDGIQFALGDMDLDTSPVPFDPMGFFDRPALDELLRRIAAYRYGESRSAIMDMNAFIRGVADIPEARRIMESKFDDFLGGTATLAGKQFICQKLALIGSGASVPTLTRMLRDSATTEIALFALEGIPGGAADTVLLGALQNSQGRTLTGAITATGNRRIGAATAALGSLAANADPVVSCAAIAALGRIGTEGALDVLERPAGTSSPDIRMATFDARLACAERLGKTSAYRSLAAAGNPLPVRSAALRGIVASDPAHAASVVRETLLGNDATLHPVAARLIPELKDIAEIRSIASALPHLPRETQAQVLSSLASFHDADVRKPVEDEVLSEYPEVRIAALRTVGASGDASDVSLLARAASRSRGEEQKSARASLDALRGAGVGDSLLALLSGAKTGLKVEVLRAIGERRVTSGSIRMPGAAQEKNGTVRVEGRATSAAPLVLACANDRSPLVRQQSARTLGLIAGENDLPAMLAALAGSRDDAFRREMERSLASVAGKVQPPAQRDAAILAAYSGAKGKQARLSLISVLGKVGGESSLPLLRRELLDKDADMRRGAILALSEWPTAGPYADLWPVAQNAQTPAERVLALRGAVRLIGIDSTHSADRIAGMYRDALNIAPAASEQKLVLSALAGTSSPAALRVAAGRMSGDQVRGEAEAAVLSIAANISDSARRECLPELRRLVASSPDTNNVKKGKDLITTLERFEDFITAWESTGPYGAQTTSLLSMPFAPEDVSRGTVSWAPFPGSTDPQRPWLLELDKVYPGLDSVVYLRTCIWSAADVKARLESSTNYGVRIWWNGSPVFTGSTMRTIGWGFDFIPAEVHKGWNTLMLKLEEGEHPWGACIRLRTSAGEKLGGIRASTVQH